MPDLTSRVNLRKPLGSEHLNSQSRPDINYNFERIDALIGAPKRSEAPASPFVGEMYMDDDGHLHVWDGSTWNHYYKSSGGLLIQSGTTSTLAGNGAYSTITFDVAYASAPVVVACPALNSGYGIPGPSCWVSNITTTNFRVAAYDTSSTVPGPDLTFKATWIAVGVGA